MAKLKNPLFSLSAKGGLGKAISFVRRGGRSIAEKKPEVPDARSPAQLIWRHMYQKAVALWHALSEAEKQEWESLARPKHMTGFAWFVSQALKPNPGLYLPLQGGKMAGDIDMDKNRLLKLPAPTSGQDADNLTSRDAAIADEATARVAAIAALAAEVIEWIATHAALDTGVHGVGASTVCSETEALAIATGRVISGQYTGDDTVNRAIAHGLGVTPKIVFITSEVSNDFFLISGVYALIYHRDATTYAVTIPDATNFYVGNAGNERLSGNELNTIHNWVAFA